MFQFIVSCITRFMQPDPKAHDYHWLSPYAYCGGDPINFIDPTGEKIYYVDMAGRLITSEEVLNKISNRPEYEAGLEGLDRVVIIDQDGKIISESDTFEEGTIDATLSIPTDLPFCGGFKSVFTLLTVNGDDNAKSIFQFLSDNITKTTGIEFGMYLLGESEDNAVNDVFTGHTKAKLKHSNKLFDIRNFMGAIFRELDHSHKENKNASRADKRVLRKRNDRLSKRQKTMPVYKVYLSKDGNYYPYDGN